MIYYRYTIDNPNCPKYLQWPGPRSLDNFPTSGLLLCHRSLPWRSNEAKNVTEIWASKTGPRRASKQWDLTNKAWVGFDKFDKENEGKILKNIWHQWYPDGKIIWGQIRLAELGEVVVTIPCFRFNSFRLLEVSAFICIICSINPIS